jgi:hypothetical protein
MKSELTIFQELVAFLDDVQQNCPQWEEAEVVSQIRRSMPEFRQRIWRISLPFNRSESDLPDRYRERLDYLRRRAETVEKLDLGHVFTSIDIRQSVDIVRDAYASWAGDLGTHVLSNFTNEAQVVVGSPDSLASLADLHGDIDGVNIANHMPEGKPVTAIAAYYQGNELLMNGVTVYKRFSTFACDLNLLDNSGTKCVDKVPAHHPLRGYTREFIEFDEIDFDGRNPFTLLSELFNEENQAKVNHLLDVALEQFLQIIASGVEQERDRRLKTL